MLAHVLHAFGGHAKDIEIMVLDICETPLMLCKWYGARQEVRVETHACDIVQWETTRQFDLIVTHSFLPMLPAPARQLLVAKWREVLRPGGKVVSTTRINPDWTEADIHSDPDRVKGFRKKCLAAGVEMAKRRWRRRRAIGCCGGKLYAPNEVLLVHLGG